MVAGRGPLHIAKAVLYGPVIFRLSRGVRELELLHAIPLAPVSALPSKCQYAVSLR